MLVKINNINPNKVNVTQLDIDDYGSVVPLRELELTLPPSEIDDSVYNILKNIQYAAVFTRQELDNENEIKDTVIILANPFTLEELNAEKNRVIEGSYEKKK
jgi:hypothetical protein